MHLREGLERRNGQAREGAFTSMAGSILAQNSSSSAKVRSESRIAERRVAQHRDAAESGILEDDSGASAEKALWALIDEMREMKVQMKDASDRRREELAQWRQLHATEVATMRKKLGEARERFESRGRAVSVGNLNGKHSRNVSAKREREDNSSARAYSPRRSRKWGVESEDDEDDDLYRDSVISRGRRGPSASREPIINDIHEVSARSRLAEFEADRSKKGLPLP